MAHFYIDNDVALSLTDLLRNKGHRATTARAKNVADASDDEHLLIAAQNQWILVTHNHKHFLLLHSAWCSWTKAWDVKSMHAGILVVPQMRASALADLLDDYVGRAGDLSNKFRYYVQGPQAGWHQYEP